MAKLRATEYSALVKLLSSKKEFETIKIGNNTTAEKQWVGGVRTPKNLQIVVRLHGHPVAKLHSEDYDGGRISVSLAGYPTLTTRDRINQLLPPGVGIFQKDHEQYFWYSRSNRTEEIKDYRDWYSFGPNES